MRISGAAGGGPEITGSGKAAIERQIRTLEKKRDEILEKLGAKKPSKKQDAADMPAGFLRLNSAGSGARGGASTSQAGEGGGETGILSGDAQYLGMALQQMSAGISSSSAGESEISEDPEELLKQLQLVTMQIMTLRQQIGDNSLEPVEMDPEEAAAIAVAGMEARAADKAAEAAAALPAAEVTAEGHVDGYA